MTSRFFLAYWKNVATQEDFVEYAHEMAKVYQVRFPKTIYDDTSSNTGSKLSNMLARDLVAYPKAMEED